MKSQPDFHTRTEIDQLVEGIYRTLQTIEERLDRRCYDIYFPMNLSISGLTSKIEAMQGELVETQSYIARRPEALASIDKRNNKSTDIHNHTSVDEVLNRGRLVQNIVGTKIRTVDFRLIRKVRKTLISQRSRISLKPHAKQSEHASEDEKK
ncbi:hypothetical protein F2Q70_00029947 [Brassica cretica]|uniref:Uncharacterized protein n=2 Tax=Brassica cretica TaxID=69181 RepID=A0A8S9FJA9_BRACR|nr:hypothetical protein F2Q70_00029947 [Brassica cretica]KAF2551896.1 hypothetical protein F2Q68_00034422 [Brassica cretica]KAF3488369.1 hypothetical protein F2Q69_00053214 [Brassica cretica]KAF3595377.1 hypothetical protein DY000_02022230 [Brassica cretica]